MLPAPAALVASLALQAGVTHYAVGAYTLGRYDTTPDALAPLKSSALELGPLVGLDYDDQTFTVGAAYFPRLVMAIDSPPPQFFNRASLDAALRPRPDLRLTVSASGCYGSNDFRLEYSASCSGWAGTGWPAGGVPANVDTGAGKTGTGGTGTGGTGTGGTGAGGTGTGGPSPGISPIPQHAQLKYLSSTATLGVEHRISIRTGLSGAVSYLVQGGADTPSRIVLPLQRGPSFWLALDWSPAPEDVLATALSGSYYTFLETAVPILIAPRTNTWVSQLSETWRRRLGPLSRLRLGLGIGATGGATEFPRLDVRRTSPVGEVGFEQDLGRPAIHLNVGARVAPFVDYTSGMAYERGEAVANLWWPVHRDWRLEASFSAGVALEGVQHGQATGTGRLSATWTVAQVALITAGLSSLWQQAGPDFPASTFREWTAFIGAGFKEVGRL